eukprot:TRINITY_DN3586_c0_g1_i2.p1 TRINITY_DN3586_c0_g1~~TRINITY_DN3586_c0_g1_i2.p1  ORF type:complete len:486 (-),score=76.42 TRINITY_DN3586_c0_g1_i2:117-1574(-)
MTLLPLRRKKASCDRITSADCKRRRVEVADIPLRRPTEPVGEAWPVRDLRAFDAPTEGATEINYGPMLKDVLKARGWIYSNKPCHGVYDEEKDKSTFYVREFEASLRGDSPQKVFGKKGAVQDGYHLQALQLPRHALWMLGRMPYRVPGTWNDQGREREDFVKIVVDNSEHLAGKAGNYRIAKFPGTETILFKTHLTEENQSFLQYIKSKGRTHKNFWIGKPRNEYGGKGICVWSGNDPDLAKTARNSEKSSRSIMQNYIADPLLVGGYKFHMRIHLVITNVDPLEAYVQENGQCLFATKPYSLSSKYLGTNFDPPVHVTNMGLNATPDNKDNFLKKKPVIGKGQQIRMRQLVNYLKKTRPDFDKQHLWRQILGIATDTSRYIAHSVRQQSKSKVVKDRHFEIFGMDLMLDRHLKVWMCEVNTDPGLGYPAQEVLGSPNPDYRREQQACEDTLHDMFTLLGLDAGHWQPQGSLKHWFKLDFSKDD